MRNPAIPLAQREDSSCIFKSLPSRAKLSCHLAHPECLPPPHARLSAPPVPRRPSRLSPPSPYLINNLPSFTQISLHRLTLKHHSASLRKGNLLNPFLHRRTLFRFSPAIPSVIIIANTEVGFTGVPDRCLFCVPSA